MKNTESWNHETGFKRCEKLASRLYQEWKGSVSSVVNGVSVSLPVVLCMESLLHSDLDKWKLRMDTLFSSSLITCRWFCGSLWGQSGFPWLGHNSLVVKRGEQLQVLVDLAIWAAFPLGFSGLLCANPPQVPAGDLGSGSDLRGASRGSAGASGALVLRTEPP